MPGFRIGEGISSNSSVRSRRYRYLYGTVFVVLEKTQGATRKWSTQVVQCMTDNPCPLEAIIKGSVNFKFRDLKIENSDDGKPVDRLEQLKPKMMLRIGFTSEISRNRAITVTTRVRIDEQMTMTRLGLPVLVLPKVQAMEDLTQYMPEAIGFAVEMVEALNRALKKKQEKSKP